MHYISRDNEPIALTSNVDIEQDGVWCWMGFFKGATAQPITPGLVIPQWIIWTRDNNDRTDVEVVKVNRVTIKVRAKDDGQTYTIRIDR